MPELVCRYVRWVDGFNRRVGLLAMYLIFVITAILFYSSLSKMLRLPANWTLESAQFVMAAYYMLGGAFAMQSGDHVRMDLFYSNWSIKKRAAFDVLTITALLVFLGFMLYGGISSSIYAIEFKERSFSAWRPYMAPIKIIMTFGVLMMLAQASSALIKDIAVLRGKPIQ
ncbi:C4-dicarboxylate ABC transporter permease [Ventosimonas gracilis]|uniref:TRAP transporter small permease protein n=1 Tax=Ventosimonas gracilis TaxID=1680762 RepID=A0A139SWL9_9GAMM|nr:TRAP transporter small permease subunit [Ventosimonas gracilis]KXU38894.1 C4-dicarboxylate ABC transporter permease [Ventosimonas gracilis]